MPHNVEKLLIRATILLQTSSQSEVYTQIYGLLKSQESQFWEFRDSQVHLGVSGQNDIWVLDLWPNTKYKGEGGGFPQVWAVVNLVNPCLFVARPCTKGVPAAH
jgi:hypothetical protein